MLLSPFLSLPVVQKQTMQLDRIDTLRKKPLEPDDFCRRWISQEQHRGGRKASIHALAKATGLSANTIRGWGPNFARRPSYVLHILRQADMINQFKVLVLQRKMSLPPSFPEE